MFVNVIECVVEDPYNYDRKVVFVGLLVGVGNYEPENTHCRGSITVQLASSFTGLNSTKQEKFYWFQFFQTR